MVLTINVPRRLRRYLAKFRTYCTDLEIEIGRHNGLNREDRLCKLCGNRNSNFIEDEYHVLLECPSYAEVRSIYLGNIDISLYAFCSIMKSTKSIELIRLANFICIMFDIRKDKL